MHGANMKNDNFGLIEFEFDSFGSYIYERTQMAGYDF